MQRNNLSKNFVEFIVKNSLGYLAPAELDELFAAIESEINFRYFDNSVEMNLIRIMEAQFDKGKFISELLQYPHHIEIITAVAVNSNFMCDILTVHPEFISLVFSPDWLEKPISEEKILKEINENSRRLRKSISRLNFLKSLKKRYMLKIGVNDLLGNYTLAQVVSSLSILSKSILSTLFVDCFNEISDSYKVKVEADFAVLTLGKLGGNELNYSSDVDLIVIYKNNYIVKAEIDLEYHQIMTDAIKLFIKRASEQTGKGYLYRIDFRLRPDGNSSPLCRTIQDTISYYEARGEDWERQMLLKMDFLCGNSNLYNRFKSFRDRYIFEKNSVNSVKAQVRRMKSNIEKYLSSEFNIKLFNGGIRDVEFSVQALQIIAGKNRPELITGNSLKALEHLTKLKLLSKNESEVLRKAYIFYRKVEHFLQLMNDRQTHELPAEPDMMNRLALFMGFKSINKFNSELDNYRKEVRVIFNSVMGENGDEIKNPNLFSNPKRAEINLNYLRSGKGLVGSKDFDSRTIDLFTELESKFLERIARTINPDKTLENFTKLVKLSGFPSIFYSQCKSEDFLSSIINLCSFNEFAINLLNSKSSLVEEIISSEFITADIAGKSSQQALINLSAKYSLKAISQSKSADKLSLFIRDKIQTVYSKHSKALPCVIIGLGSFALNEMNFYSDADLVFFIKDIEKYPEAETRTQKMFAEIKRELFPIEVDCRLRPEGESSQLIWDMQEYANYFGKRARMWEFQTLIKLSRICGPEEDFNYLKRNLIKHASRFEPERIKSELLSIYRKFRSTFIQPSNQIDIKTDHGGLMTIDFILFYLIFKNTELFKNALGKSASVKINLVKEKYQKLSVELERLNRSYSYYKEIISAVNVNFNRKKPRLNNESAEETEQLTVFLEKEVNVQILNNMMKFNSDLFNNLFLK